MSMTDPRAEANAYLAEKKVLELFHDLGTKLVYSKVSSCMSTRLGIFRNLTPPSRSPTTRMPS